MNADISNHRIKSSRQILQIRTSGKPFSDRLLVLICNLNNLDHSRAAIIASRAVGGAVERNRCKRRLRARIARLLPALAPGYDLVFVARKPLLRAEPTEVDRALEKVVTEAGLL